MGKISNFFRTKKVAKIVGIVIFIIIIILAIWFWSIFAPTFKIVGILDEINGTSYSLEKSKSSLVYNGSCRVNVYPSKNLYEPDLIQSQNDKNTIFLYVGSATTRKNGSVAISVETTDEYNTLNYFVYNGRNYFYNLNSGGILFTTMINDNYLYWVMINDYSNLTKEDIESILYFETK